MDRAQHSCTRDIYCVIPVFAWCITWLTYPAVVRLLGKNLWLTSGDGKVGFRDLEDLDVVQFAVVGAVTVCLLSTSFSSDSGSKDCMHSFNRFMDFLRI